MTFPRTVCQHTTHGADHDPRVDPKPGDVLIGPGRGRRESRRVTKLTDTIGGEYIVGYVCRRQSRITHIQMWRIWAKTAAIRALSHKEPSE